MATKPAITVEHVKKSFRLPHERASGLKQTIVNFHKRQRGYEQQQVLKNISFEIKQGEFFGIVGRNGSGKSTLLKLLAGVYIPDSGRVIINGSLTPFIELGVGFNPELTGRENVFLNGALLGFNRQEMTGMYQDIVEFAELEQFMDQKLKNYSSGMQVRLAFSIAIRANSDILLLDEVLAVGDAIFQKKCYDYFRQLKKEGRTVVFVSHDISALQEYCDKGILIEKGKIVTSGDIDHVTNTYIELLNETEEAAHQEKEGDQKRWGSGDIEITSTRTTSQNVKKAIFSDADKFIDVTVKYQVKKPVEKPIYGITIFDAVGQRVFVSNTLWLEKHTDDVIPGDHGSITWSIPNIFNTGTFTVSPAIADRSGSNTFDWVEEMAEFKVRKKTRSNAIINVDHEIVVTKEDQSS